MKIIEGGVTAPKGFVAGGIHAGIRKNQTKKDLAVIYSETLCDAAAVYTQNLVKGAPITVTQKNLKSSGGKAHVVLCNSGNANTCNADGEDVANAMCKLVAKELDISATEVIIASTGVIGQKLCIDPIAKAMPEPCKNLSIEGGENAASAIMTTDLFKKEIAVEFMLGDKVCKIGAIAKGSGMIHPNMATMLGFVTTDVNIDGDLLHKTLVSVTADTFNMISVDGDTSTNDMVSVMANGLAGNAKITDAGENLDTFESALYTVCETLAIKIAEDGEGATKLLTAVVSNAPDKQSAQKIAKSIISSSLVKSAFFGEDANWGRILCAIGYAGAQCDINKPDIDISSAGGEITVCKAGKGAEFDEVLGKKVLAEKSITIAVNMNQGKGSATAWGCDLTYDYVKINGDYRT